MGASLADGGLLKSTPKVNQGGRLGPPRWLNSLREKYFLRHRLTSVAKAAVGSRTVIAALKRCATQNQVQHPKIE